MLLKVDPQTLLMIGSTNVTHISVRVYVYMHVYMYVVYACNVCTLRMYMRCCSDWFHECYSKLVPQMLLEIDPQTLLKMC